MTNIFSLRSPKIIYKTMTKWQNSLTHILFGLKKLIYKKIHITLLFRDSCTLLFTYFYMCAYVCIYKIPFSLLIIWKQSQIIHGSCPIFYTFIQVHTYAIKMVTESVSPKKQNIPVLCHYYISKLSFYRDLCSEQNYHFSFTCWNTGSLM